MSATTLVVPFDRAAFGIFEQLQAKKVAVTPVDFGLPQSPKDWTIGV
jgi:hypothetical protein